MDQYSRATNAAISSSRSQIMRSAGTLHPAGGQARAHFLPQQRREIESHQKIQGAACLLGVHQVDGQLAGARHRLADRVLGDLVEHHPLDLLALEFALGLQELVQVP